MQRPIKKESLSKDARGALEALESETKELAELAVHGPGERNAAYYDRFGEEEHTDSTGGMASQMWENDYGVRIREKYNSLEERLYVELHEDDVLEYLYGKVFEPRVRELTA